MALVQIAKMERRVELEDGDCTRYIAAPSRERRENLHIVESSGSAPVTRHRGWQLCIVLCDLSQTIEACIGVLSMKKGKG